MRRSTSSSWMIPGNVLSSSPLPVPRKRTIFTCRCCHASLPSHRSSLPIVVIEDVVVAPHRRCHPKIRGPCLMSLIPHNRHPPPTPLSLAFVQRASLTPHRPLSSSRPSLSNDLLRSRCQRSARSTRRMWRRVTSGRCFSRRHRSCC